jgi:hypothetical protein
MAVLRVACLNLRPQGSFRLPRFTGQRAAAPPDGRSRVVVQYDDD